MSTAWKRFMHRALKRQWRKYEALAERCLASEAERNALQRQTEEIGRDLQVANQQVAASITVIADLIRQRDEAQARLAGHTTHIAEFLNELYVTMIDPCTAGQINVFVTTESILESVRATRNLSGN
jgi:septal ring factor EnvC (AmiA/AmiB activator)